MFMLLGLELKYQTAKAKSFPSKFKKEQLVALHCAVRTCGFKSKATSLDQGEKGPWKPRM